MSKSSAADPTVFIVDDDQSIRHAMALLMRSVGLRHRIFQSGMEFLEDYTPDIAGCLVLDIRMPGMGGLELQDKLAERGSTLPVIFITGFADVPMAVEAMQKGAFDFLEKPFRDQELLDRINDALQVDSTRRAHDEETRRVQAHMGRLTQREREVMDLVVTGKPNKIIAHELDVSQRTVEIHRARVMDKMEARSLADLVRMILAASPYED
ncbi:MAG TPA: response regulator transcription factor [Woeseiaceae bacterium]|nr:response regulator transcription factor [Woeseiaceae bacterium]